MLNNITLKSNFDGLDLDVNYIEPSGSIKGIVIIAHGMTEHKERYNYFLEKLVNNNYMAVIFDARGHGKSVKSDLHGYFYTEDETAFRTDLYTVLTFFKNRYKQANKVILFAHSMGTLVARSFMQVYDKEIDKVILCGPPTKNNLVGIGLLVANISKIFDGGKKPNKFLNKLTLEPFNKGYQVANSWLSKNPVNVDNYNNDSLCNFIFTTNGFLNLYKLQKDAFNSKAYQVNNKDLSIYLLAGTNDPVIGNANKFAALKDFFIKLGYKKTQSKMYDNLRHELLQEDEKDYIINDIITFIEENN